MKKVLPIQVITCLLSILFLYTCSNESTNNEIDDFKLVNADQFPGDWLSYGRNYKEDRHSSLNQINAATIDRLGLVWSVNLGTKRGLEATPIVADGIMYFTATWSKVFAVDVRKGEVLWTYDPEVPREWGEKVCCDVVNRGVAIYKNLIFVGTLDGRLIALNAQTGEKAWEVLTVDQAKAYSITGAPRVVKGNVIIGNGGAEFGTRGYVTAYDAMTGKQEWRFYTVPGNPNEAFESEAMEVAAKTWTGQWWKFGGGGTVWDAMAFDPELNLLYVGTGNGSPWNRNFRSPEGGDNLYLSSILALNSDTGELVWYYQTTPGETWDFTATQHIILADLEVGGQDRKVLMQAPKNGFFYVLDRTNGQLISAEPYVYTNWATAIDKATGRPMETSFARYPNMNAQLAPGPGGGHNWQPMAYNSKTGLVYIPAREDGSTFGQPKEWKFFEDGRVFNTGRGFNPENEYRRDSLAARDFGKLIAWNPIEQKEVWSVWQKSSWNAGVLTTDELVFQGNAEGEFSAYDAATGDKLWSTNLQTGIIASPVTYEVDGTQYVSILVGWGGFFGHFYKFTEQINTGTLYTFALDGKESLPDFPKVPKKELVRLDFDASDEEIAQGGQLYEVYCRRCHGGGIIPDLTYSTPEIFSSFQQIVGDGNFIGLGMPKFGDRLSETEIQNIKYFILSQAKSRREMQLQKPRRLYFESNRDMKNIGLFIIIVLGSNSCYHSNEGRTDSFELEQNKKIAASYILEVVNNKNLDILEDIFSPNYISHEKNGNNTNSIEDGSLITFLQYLFNAFPDLHYRVIDVIAEGDMVSLNLEAKGTHRNEFLGFKASGNKITFREMFFFKLANRKIMEGWSVVDVEQVKEQLRKQQEVRLMLVD